MFVFTKCLYKTQQQQHEQHHVVVITTETLGWYFLTEPMQQAVMCAAALPLITNCFSVARFYCHTIFHEIYYHTFTTIKLSCITVHYG